MTKFTGPSIRHCARKKHFRIMPKLRNLRLNNSGVCSVAGTAKNWKQNKGNRGSLVKYNDRMPKHLCKCTPLRKALRSAFKREEM